MSNEKKKTAMQKLLDAALNQFTGFAHAKSGYSAKSLAESMGLTEPEWKILRNQSGLSLADKAEIDSLFYS